MKKILKKIINIVFIGCLSAYSYAEIKIKFLDNYELSQNVESSRIQKLIVTNSILKNKVFKNAASAIIVPIYSINVNHTHQLNYYLLFVSSSLNYSVSTTQIFIMNDEISKIIENYTPTKSDLRVISAKYLNYAPVCPNNNINFVVGSGLYTDDPSKAIRFTINDVYEKATAKGYNVVKLLDQNATVNNYLDYLSCKNLKGFFNIGHGTSNSIILHDGEILTSELIEEHLKDKLSNVVIVFNSCGTFGNHGNNELRYALVNVAKIQKFSGGITALQFGTSEATSRCFWTRALNGVPLENGAMDVCQNLFDPIDEWGIGGYGSNYLKVSVAN